jgi:predicted DsbA family dithiol-disulfide isomerase
LSNADHLRIWFGSDILLRKIQKAERKIGMSSIQVFYDYECPFCKRGLESFEAALAGAQNVDIDWRPIESHPRPETVHPHTDLCIQAFYYAQEQNVNPWEFHKTLFRALIDERKNVEEPQVLAHVLSSLVDETALLAALSQGKYESWVNENNNLAYDEKDVWFVPAFRSGTTKLDAVGGAGVTDAQLKEFIAAL